MFSKTVVNGELCQKFFDNWHTIYIRMNRWAKFGMLNNIFFKLQKEQLISIKIEAISLDSANIKVHPDETGALKNSESKQLGSLVAGATPNFVWLSQVIGLR